ncbi:SpaH/EbpB family LPXTG-anchored major pilin, partial [Pontibacillus litoralis]
LNVFIVFTLLLSIFIPQSVFAYTVSGDEANPTLTINKFEREPGALEGEPGTGGDQTPPSDATPLQGVEYTITQTHSYDPATDEWTEVTGGATLTETTDANGQAVFSTGNGLELGRYTVEETNGPDHVILNPETFSVDIPMTNKEGTELNYDVKIYPKNETIRSGAELIKKDADGNLLQGVGFTLYNEDGTVATDDEDNQIGELTTDANGKITVDNLAQGKYYFQETTTPDGFATNHTKIWFEVKKDTNGQDIVVDWTPVDGFVDANGHVTNYKEPEIEKDVEGQGHLDVDRDKEYKYNMTIKTPQDINKYKALGVTDTLDNRLEFIADGSITDGWEVTGTTKGNITFTQNGQELVWEVNDLSQLTPGEDITITFTAKIKPDAVLANGEVGIENTASLDFNNDNGHWTEKYPTDPTDPTDPVDPPTTPPVTVTPTEGGVQVIKVDASDNSITLEGAEFKLTTDEAGENVVNTTETGDVVTVNGTVHNGLLENLTTDANGEFSIEGLTPGTYYLHETKAPTYTDKDGNEKPYRLLTNAIEVTITDDVTSNEYEVMVENSKSGWELPTTGGIGSTLFTLFGLTLMGIALVLFLRRRNSAA